MHCSARSNSLRPRVRVIKSRIITRIVPDLIDRPIRGRFDPRHSGQDEEQRPRQSESCPRTRTVTIISGTISPRYKRAHVDNSIAITPRPGRAMRNSRIHLRLKKTLQGPAARFHHHHHHEESRLRFSLHVRNLIYPRGNDNVTSDKPPRL